MKFEDVLQIHAGSMFAGGTKNFVCLIKKLTSVH
ncbi:hypothetical protein RSC2_00172 [Bacillus paralicheniformis]|nr:hypothetical protein RSC1_02739 [Bacillus paralicheniformis]BCE08376.1 hypothetical protein RSC2_00172 [Bacillus paralicheniformis]